MLSKQLKEEIGAVFRPLLIMSDLRPTGTKITLGDKEYILYFDLNAIDDIQDHFDISIAELPDLMKDDRKTYKVLKYLLSVLINEGIDEFETGEKHTNEREIGRKLNMSNISEVSSKIMEAFSGSTPVSDEEDDPNVKSE